jgi:hypothetical protein
LQEMKIFPWYKWQKKRIITISIYCTLSICLLRMSPSMTLR